MKLPRIVVAGTNSGVGKSTVSLALMAGFQQRGLTTQGFKVGPDYIDGSYHTAITGRTSRNLDSWMLTHDMVQTVFAKAAKDADLSIIEGVMGFYDGKSPSSNEGSTAEMSLLLACPVILVIDASGMARSAAAMVKGYQSLDERVHIAGVIANRVGGEGHYRLIQEAVEDACGVPVVGYLTQHDEIKIPERHLGLVPAIERGEHTSMFKKLGDLATATIDLDAILSIATASPDLGEEPSILQPTAQRAVPNQPPVSIAVARDAAFNFYYEENLEFLNSYGAELVFFSPLAGDEIPSAAHGLYIGGGFPEEFAAQLSAHHQTRASLFRHIQSGLPTYAECGGYMYLTEELTDVGGKTHAMVGVIPARVSIQKRLSGFGYREVTGTDGNWLVPSGEKARGHEFHYSSIAFHTQTKPAYRTTGNKPVPFLEEGYFLDNVIAGYTHLHFGSNPNVAKRFVERCARFRDARA